MTAIRQFRLVLVSPWPGRTGSLVRHGESDPEKDRSKTDGTVVKKDLVRELTLKVPMEKKHK